MARAQRRGIIYAGCGWLAYLGPTPPLSAHAHPALGLYVGLDGPIRVGDATRSVPLLCVPPETVTPPITPDGREMAFLFLSAEHPAFADARARTERSSCHETPGQLQTLAALLREIRRERTGGDEAFTRIAEALALEDTPPTHSRLERALAWLRDHPTDELSLEDVARHVHLSPRRFQTVFREGTGIRFRRYRLWQRLQAAAEELPQYRHLTDLALTAGFADLAHLSRSFRDMFGIAPFKGLRAAGPFSFRPIRNLHPPSAGLTH
ncbi:helix-turn-helix domain-containing protein [Aquisalimonas asiatica]|uniref:AraC-type DNA-binding protein n=1 Tax=Aquisalimonas asiatica TaxID=406100 RepID=A0A1H8U0V5_9GAMM|nr:AraC family transcriptional regulator [Aquisalimonas asiatica]SEO96494.1 AraC-type DNA-binding protein [Aquisalimonas asiatica]